MNNPQIIQFYMLAKWEIPYSEAEHLLSLPIDVRKMELLRILLTTTPANRELHDFQLKDFEKAMGQTYWEMTKSKLDEQRDLAMATGVAVSE